MARSVFPWLLAGGAAVAIVYYGARSAARRAAVLIFDRPTHVQAETARAQAEPAQVAA